MIQALIVVGSILGYAAIGAGYARTQALNCDRRARRYGSGTREESLNLQLIWRVVLWPWAVVFDLLRGGIGNWIKAPVNRRQASIDQLREDIRSWERKLDGTEAEQAMARQLLPILQGQLRGATKW